MREILTPLLKSANPLMPNVSASCNKFDICSSKTFTSPAYMNVNRLQMDGNDVPGSMITGCWCGAASRFRKSSAKKVLHALRMILCAFIVRPSAERVTSVRYDWSKRPGNEPNRLAWWLCHRRQNCCEFGVPGFSILWRVSTWCCARDGREKMPLTMRNMR